MTTQPWWPLRSLQSSNLERQTLNSDEERRSRDSSEANGDRSALWVVVLIEGMSKESSIQAELEREGGAGKMGGRLGGGRAVGKRIHSQGSKNEREGARLSGERERP